MVSGVGRYVTVSILRLRVKSTVLELVEVILFPAAFLSHRY